MSSSSKREVLERLLREGMVMVELDARRPGVRVPPSLRGDPKLRLNLSYRFAHRDLSVGDEVIGCTLSFAGQPYYCELPVDAITAVTSLVTGEQRVWPQSLTATLESQRTPGGPLAAVATPDGEGERTGSGASVAARRHLRLVK